MVTSREKNPALLCENLPSGCRRGDGSYLFCRGRGGKEPSMQDAMSRRRDDLRDSGRKKGKKAGALTRQHDDKAVVRIWGRRKKGGEKRLDGYRRQEKRGKREPCRLFSSRECHRLPRHEEGKKRRQSSAPPEKRQGKACLSKATTSCSRENPTDLGYEKEKKAMRAGSSQVMLRPRYMGGVGKRELGNVFRFRSKKKEKERPRRSIGRG